MPEPVKRKAPWLRSGGGALLTAWYLMVYTNLASVALAEILPRPQAPASGCGCLVACSMERPCCCALAAAHSSAPAAGRACSTAHSSARAVARACSSAGLPTLAAAPCCTGGSSDALAVDGGCRFPHLPVHLGFATPLLAEIEPFAARDQSPRAPFLDPPEKIPI